MSLVLNKTIRILAPTLCLSFFASIAMTGCSCNPNETAGNNGGNAAAPVANNATFGEGSSRPPSGLRNPVLWSKDMDEGDKIAAEMLDPTKKVEKPQAPVKTSDGLEIQDLTVGWGMSPSANKMAMVHYTGYLADGTKFESSRDRGMPFQFIVGSGKVIKGFEQGIMGMKVGGKRKIIIPPSLGYGAEGHGDKIPPNATLTYEISLLSCDR